MIDNSDEHLIVNRALATDGWMYPPEILWLAEEALKHHHIVELGCMVGRSTRALADNCPDDGVVVAFDWFEGPTTSTGPLSYHFPNPGIDQLKIFSQNLADHLETGKVVIKAGDHRGFIYDQTPDMVFIDGDHLYDNVKSDILEWQRRLVPGGLLCGHDIGIPDVERAVRELLPDAIFPEDTTIWAWTKPR